jgi:TRAP-type C4-dicarboxylate transport system substrate-binding protein
LKPRKLSRRSFARAALATTTLSTVNILHYPADAAEFTLKFGDNQISTYPVNTALAEAAQRMRDASGGRLDFQMFINGQLGTDTDMLNQVRSGALHFYCVSGAVLSTLVPISAIPDVGFAF